MVIRIGLANREAAVLKLKRFHKAGIGFLLLLLPSLSMLGYADFMKRQLPQQCEEVYSSSTVCDDEGGPCNEVSYQETRCYVESDPLLGHLGFYGLFFSLVSLFGLYAFCLYALWVFARDG